jgi:hypothetical protein
MELTTATKTRGRELGWSDELIARIEASPLKDRVFANLALLNVAPERVGAFLDMVDRNPDRFNNLSLNFIRTKSERGVKAKPGPIGLGTPEINIGTYGQVPDYWPYENDTPLGSHPDFTNFGPGSYTIYEKAEVWAEGCDVLYEQAILDRWIPATDLDWNNGLRQLPEELERATCQLATVYSSHGLVEQKIISKWFEEISYGFHDVKLFLGTQVYDAGHKVEALRKRALANGGGLGQAPLGTLYRGWYGALKFSEMITALDVIYKSYELTLFEAAQDFAKTDLDAQLFGLMAKDSRRHLEYGKRHLLWYLQHKDRGEGYATFFLNRGEAALSNEMRHSPEEREALILLFANGRENASQGVDKLRALRQKQLMDYIAVLDEVGMDRLPNVNVGLAQLAENPLAV